jgi:hypothetical protein
VAEEADPDTVEIAPEAVVTVDEPAPPIADRKAPEPIPADLGAEDPEDHFMADDDMRGGRDGTTH